MCCCGLYNNENYPLFWIFIVTVHKPNVYGKLCTHGIPNFQCMTSLAHLLEKNSQKTRSHLFCRECDCGWDTRSWTSKRFFCSMLSGCWSSCRSRHGTHEFTFHTGKNSRHLFTDHFPSLQGGKQPKFSLFWFHATLKQKLARACLGLVKNKKKKSKNLKENQSGFAKDNPKAKRKCFLWEFMRVPLSVFCLPVPWSVVKRGHVIILVHPVIIPLLFLQFSSQKGQKQINSLAYTCDYDWLREWLAERQNNNGNRQKALCCKWQCTVCNILRLFFPLACGLVITAPCPVSYTKAVYHPN